MGYIKKLYGWYIFRDIYSMDSWISKRNNANKQQEIKESAWEQWTSYFFLNGSDYSKYGSLLCGFQQQFSLGNNQYPKTIVAATDALSSHKFDAKYYNKHNRWNQQQQKEENNQKTITSFV